MKSDNYNGWTNYETWNAALWLGNEENSSCYCDEIAQEAYDQAEANQSFSRMENAAFTLSEQLKGLFESEEKLPLSGWMADAINAYLSEVNWYEIAQSFLENIEIEEESFNNNKREEQK